MDTTDNGTMSDGTISDGSAPAPGPRRRRWRRGGLVTVGTVSALVAAMGLTVLGLGAADNAVASYDASSWLWSTTRSELARVNGITARVDTRVAGSRRAQPPDADRPDRPAADPAGSADRAGQLTWTWPRCSSWRPRPPFPGSGSTSPLHEDAAFVVDAVQGIVRQLDPRSLAPVGEPLQLPAGHHRRRVRRRRAALDRGAERGHRLGDHRRRSRRPLPAPARPTAERRRLRPEQVETFDVADRSHELVVSTLDDGVAVLDRTAGALATRRAARSTADGPADADRSGRAAGAHQRRPGAGDGARRARGARGRRRAAGARGFTVPGGGATRSARPWPGRAASTAPTRPPARSTSSTPAAQLVDTIARPAERPARAGGPREPPLHQLAGLVHRPGGRRQAPGARGRQVRQRRARRRPAAGAARAPPPPPAEEAAGEQAGRAAQRHRLRRQRQARVSWRPAAANGAAITKYVVHGRRAAPSRSAPTSARWSSPA